jgi:glutamate racemase
LLTGYLAPFLDAGVDTLILGCTHYAAIKGLVREVAGPGITVISQDELVPKKLSGYLDRHPEIGERLGTGGSREFEVTGLARQGFTQVSYGMSFTS